MRDLKLTLNAMLSRLAQKIRSARVRVFPSVIETARARSPKTRRRMTLSGLFICFVLMVAVEKIIEGCNLTWTYLTRNNIKHFSEIMPWRTKIGQIAIANLFTAWKKKYPKKLGAGGFNPDKRLNNWFKKEEVPNKWFKSQCQRINPFLKSLSKIIT